MRQLQIGDWQDQIWESILRKAPLKQSQILQQYTEHIKTSYHPLVWGKKAIVY